MAAAGSRPHLILPAQAIRHLPQAAASALWTPGLRRNPDGYTFMQIAQTVPLQVDMAMALQRVRIEEKYGKSYLCLLQAVFVAGKPCPSSHSPPGGGLGLLPGSLHSSRSLPIQPMEKALCLRSTPSKRASPHCSGSPICKLAGISFSVPLASRGAAGVQIWSQLRHWRTVRKAKGDVELSLRLIKVLVSASNSHLRGRNRSCLPTPHPAHQNPAP